MMKSVIVASNRQRKSNNVNTFPNIVELES